MSTNVKNQCSQEDANTTTTATTANNALQQKEWQIILDGKHHLRSKNASSAIKRDIRALINTYHSNTSPEELQDTLQTTQQLQKYATKDHSITFNVSSIDTANTVTLVIRQTQSSIEKQKLKEKLQQLQQQRSQTIHASTGNHSINKAYKKLITTLNQQPTGAMLTKLIPDPQKLSESSLQELQMQISLFESLPMNNQLKRLILNYFKSAN